MGILKNTNFIKELYMRMNHIQETKHLFLQFFSIYQRFAERNSRKEVNI